MPLLRTLPVFPTTTHDIVQYAIQVGIQITYLSQQQLGVVQVQSRRGRGVDGQGCRDGNETE